MIINVVDNIQYRQATRQEVIHSEENHVYCGLGDIYNSTYIKLERVAYSLNNYKALSDV